MNTPAAGSLESIRALLNTWRIPNDTRRPVDELPALLADRAAWEARLPGIRAPRHVADRQAITHVRDTLRASIAVRDAAAIDELVSACQWRLAIETDVDTGSDTVRWSVDPGSAAGDVLAFAVDAIAAGTWPRLRTCPDCQWAFYDSSRNAQRTWCSMTAIDGARGCGSIAKTRAYRQRRRAAR